MSDGTSAVEWTLEEFCEKLYNAIQEDAGTIRETNLDEIRGVFVNLCIQYESGQTQHIVGVQDKFGRLTVPAALHGIAATRISVDSSPSKPVIRQEPRYRNDQVVSWVFYLEGVSDESVQKTN